MKKVIDDEGVRGVDLRPPGVGSAAARRRRSSGSCTPAPASPGAFTREECDLLAALGRDTGVVLAGVYRQAGLEQARDDLARRNKTLQRHMRFLGDVADTFADTGDLTAGLHAWPPTGSVSTSSTRPAVCWARPGRRPATSRRPCPSRPAASSWAGWTSSAPIRSRPTTSSWPSTPDVSWRCSCSGSAAPSRRRSGCTASCSTTSWRAQSPTSGHHPPGSLLGVDLRAPGLVVCFGVHRPAAEHDKAPTINRAAADLIERLARQRFDQALVAFRGDQVVLLAGIGDRDHATAHSMMRRLLAMASELMGGKPLAAGVGRLCLSLGDYADSFAEACTALELAMSRPDPGHVLTPADLGLLAVLGRGQQKQPLRELVKPPWNRS